MPRSTIQDVAKLAGVYTATVSHVINGTRFVSNQTKKVVLEAIETLSYVPDLAARNLKTGKKNTIGFITPTFANSYFFNIIEAVESVIRSAGYSLLISNSKENPKKEIQSFRYLSSGLVDGIIAISTLLDFQDIADVVPKNLPVLLIDRVLDNCRCDTLTVSTYDSVYEITLSFLRSGRHQKIGYLASDDDLKTTMERLRGFQDALAAEHWTPKNAFICQADSTANAQDAGAAYQQVANMLDNGVTAILVSTNVMTQEALRCLSERNLSPVKDVEIVGLFNPPYVYPCPGMRWINMPGRTLGTLAGKTILKRLNTPGAPWSHQVLKSDIVVNSSI